MSLCHVGKGSRLSPFPNIVSLPCYSRLHIHVLGVSVPLLSVLGIWAEALPPHYLEHVTPLREKLIIAVP